MGVSQVLYPDEELFDFISSVGHSYGVITRVVFFCF